MEFKCMLPLSHFGRGKLNTLSELITGYGRKAMLTIDPFLENNGLGARITDMLRADGIDTVLWSDIQSNPSCFGADEAAQMVTANLDGVSARIKIDDLKLFSDREVVHEFRVPDRLVNLTATLRLRVKIASEGGKEIELSDSRTFAVNEILAGAEVADFFLSKIDGRYRVESFGRSGEPQAGQNVNVSLRHRSFGNQLSVTLKTGENGAIDLGPLDDLSFLQVSAPGIGTRSWNLADDRRNVSPVITLEAGRKLRIPFVGELNRRKVAFFAISKGGLVSDQFSALTLEEGYLTATPGAGDYHLHLKESSERIHVMVAAGSSTGDFVFNDTRMLELPARTPSHLKEVKVDGENLFIDLSEADALTRVHIMATRFVPGNDPFLSLGGSQRAGLTHGQSRYLPSLYISGRNLGDELRYILERRFAQKFPGNMLTRPEILLNPWAIRDTEAGEEILTQGDKFNRKAVTRPEAAAAPAAFFSKKQKSGVGSREPSYEFLAETPVFIANLKPGKDGIIKVNLNAFGDRQHVHVLLVDPEGATYRTVSLPDRKTGVRDLRLMKNALDPKRHFSEQEKVSILKKGESLKLEDLLSSRFEIFDDLPSVYRYFTTLKNDSTLREFSFVTKWPDLTEVEKKAKYSQYACHELSFFLSRKDPVFFESVVRPHLSNKKDRTFMDDYLLETELGKYFEPFEYSRLNVVERLLLTQNDPRRFEALTRDLEDRLALKSPDVDQSRVRFETVLTGAAFGGGYAGKVLDEKNASVETLSRNLGEKLSKAADTDEEAKSESKRRNSGRMREQQEALEELEALVPSKLGEVADAFIDGGLALNDAVAPFYRALEPTKEWAENNYYHRRMTEHTYQLVDENPFWLDLARHGFKPGFGSQHLGEASGNFTEMMLALSFLDLPFDAPEHSDTIENGALDFTAGGNVLFFHREVKEAGMAANRPPLLVSQSYFRADDRFKLEDGQKVDKYVTAEFIRGVVYGAQVVVTNPTSANQRLDILTQIPKGALPLAGQRPTANQPVAINPYSTHRLELLFYFPSSGEFPVYPAHVSRSGDVVAHADPMVFKVVDEPSSVDQTSWAWISQWAGEELVLKYLTEENLHAIDLSQIAWRVRENAAFFQKVVAILDSRGLYHEAIQAYAVQHNDETALGRYLLMQSQFLNQCGLALECDLVSMNPINRRAFEHLEYNPLVNNRAHSLGGKNRILNPVIRTQYQRFLQVLSQQKTLDDLDRLGVTYHLFLQDRIGEALMHLEKVDPSKLETRMQYDYFKAYAAFYQADLGMARQLAGKYEKYPVDRWRERFAGITAQIAEIDGAAPQVIDDGNREQEQEMIAAREPAMTLEITGPKAEIDYQNIEEVTVNFYEMDLEFLFSTKPFVASGTSRFGIIQPNKSIALDLNGRKGKKTFDLPEEFRASNIIVEVIGGGRNVSKAVYSNNLKTVLSEQMGILSVRHGKTGKPLPGSYVKVYADTTAGVKFYKDGYTDLRGKFDYASVSSTGEGEVRKFSILVMSESDGATVLEALVPQR